MRVAAESGGDEFIEVIFDNGDADDIKGGGFVHVQVGRLFTFFANKPALMTELTAGYKTDSVNASNGDLVVR